MLSPPPARCNSCLHVHLSFGTSFFFQLLAPVLCSKWLHLRRQLLSLAAIYHFSCLFVVLVLVVEREAESWFSQWFYLTVINISFLCCVEYVLHDFFARRAQFSVTIITFISLNLNYVGWNSLSACRRRLCFWVHTFSIYSRFFRASRRTVDPRFMFSLNCMRAN